MSPLSVFDEGDNGIVSCVCLDCKSAYHRDVIDICSLLLYIGSMAKDTRPQINIRASMDEIALFEEARKVAGLNLSAWLRFVAIKAARKELAEAKKAA